MKYKKQQKGGRRHRHNTKSSKYSVITDKSMCRGCHPDAYHDYQQSCNDGPKKYYDNEAAVNEKCMRNNNDNNDKEPPNISNVEKHEETTDMLKQIRLANDTMPMQRPGAQGIATPTDLHNHRFKIISCDAQNVGRLLLCSKFCNTTTGNMGTEVAGKIVASYGSNGTTTTKTFFSEK